MSSSFATGVGAVLSADVALPQHERVRHFYSRVLTTGTSPLWREDLSNNLGIPIIGAGARNEQHAELPVQWMPHIQVASVADSVERAIALGGAELMHAKDANGASLWAVLRDPNGAAFGVVSIVPPEMLPPLGDAGDVSMGRIAWLDLTVDDADRTRDFYAAVIGWTPENVGMTDGDHAYADYNMLGASGTPMAGVCHARGGNAGLPPVWMIYLPVGDLGESLRRVQEEGGTVIKSMQNRNGEYVYAAIQDPAGACLALAPG